METSPSVEERIQRMALELAEELGDLSSGGEYGSPFAALEARAAEIGDRIMRELTRIRVQQASATPVSKEHSACPDCGAAGECTQLRDRTLQTIRGDINFQEVAFYCRKCRRSFFPSGPLARR